MTVGKRVGVEKTGQQMRYGGEGEIMGDGNRGEWTEKRKTGKGNKNAREKEKEARSA